MPTFTDVADGVIGEAASCTSKKLTKPSTLSVRIEYFCLNVLKVRTPYVVSIEHPSTNQDCFGEFPHVIGVIGQDFVWSFPTPKQQVTLSELKSGQLGQPFWFCSGNLWKRQLLLALPGQLARKPAGKQGGVNASRQCDKKRNCNLRYMYIICVCGAQRRFEDANWWNRCSP